MPSAPAGFPTVTVQVAFASTPGAATPTWTDITDYLMGFSSRRGRSDELQAYNAGTLALALDNQDGRFDPTNTASPYYPNVLPMKLVQVKAVWNSVTYYVFTGYIDGWPMGWDLNKQDRMQVTATDAFKVLGLYYYRNDFEPQETIATRVTAIAAAASVPVVYNGSSTVVAAEAVQSYALGHLQALEETEAGSMFIDEQGKLRFEDRHYRSANKLTVQATFGDANTGELAYQALQPVYDDTQIINDASIDASKAVYPLATPAQYTDATSQTAYLPRSITKDLLFADANECADMAWWLVQRFKTPALRFDSIQFVPASDPTNLWPQALGRVIGDLIRCLRRPPSGNTIDQQCHIDAVEHSWDGNSMVWTTRWGLSPKASTFSQWKLNDATYSVLGSTTVLNY